MVITLDESSWSLLLIPLPTSLTRLDKLTTFSVTNFLSPFNFSSNSFIRIKSLLKSSSILRLIFSSLKLNTFFCLELETLLGLELEALLCLELETLLGLELETLLGLELETLLGLEVDTPLELDTLLRPCSPA